MDRQRNPTVGAPGARSRLIAIHSELMCEVDRLHHQPLEEPDLFLEFLAGHMRILAEELYEILAAVGGMPLEMAA